MSLAATATTVVTLPTEFIRAGIAGPDPDGSAVPFQAAWPCQSLRLGASCDTAGASLSLTVVFRGSAGQPIGTASLSFTAPAVANFAGTFLAVPAYDPCWPLSGARTVGVKVDAVTAGTWTIAGAMA